ncbi:Cell wall beta-glucan synthesis [Penicillium italicum]|uniref:Cell wall beta-glucan synthesis n=1 Tax=Penicillium italicum TaxID=40296 RepID=A0A0A2KQL5_PENIT|nr:Cell wall beta-glucan synthesis [Penicillium italicum]
MRINIISLVALAATAAALTVTSPRIGEKIDPDMPLTIKWQSVTTDPETFSIELVNQNVYPPTTTVVAEDIDTSKGSYTVKAKTFTDVDDGKGYQINFLSPTSGILAQSQQFRVTEPGEIASSASSSGKETSTALETSSLISSASTSDITSALSSSTASSYLSSTATHSSIISTSVSTISSTSLSTATHSSTTSTTTRKTTSTTTSTATESATTTSNAAAVLMPPAGSLLLGLFALVL